MLYEQKRRWCNEKAFREPNAAFAYWGSATEQPMQELLKLRRAVEEKLQIVAELEDKVALGGQLTPFEQQRVKPREAENLQGWPGHDYRGEFIDIRTAELRRASPRAARPFSWRPLCFQPAMLLARDRDEEGLHRNLRRRIRHRKSHCPPEHGLTARGQARARGRPGAVRRPGARGLTVVLLFAFRVLRESRVPIQTRNAMCRTSGAEGAFLS
jgi:hypothetical protein